MRQSGGLYRPDFQASTGTLCRSDLEAHVEDIYRDHITQALKRSLNLAHEAQRTFGGHTFPRREQAVTRWIAEHTPDLL